MQSEIENGMPLKSPTAHLLEFCGQRFLFIRLAHLHIHEGAVPVGGVGFSRFHQRTDISAQRAFVHQFLAVGLDEHKVGVREHVAGHRPVDSCIRRNDLHRGSLSPLWSSYSDNRDQRQQNVFHSFFQHCGSPFIHTI